MKPAQIALIAVLSLPCAAMAGPKPFPVSNPGPHALQKDQPACQNFINADELDRYRILNNRTAEAEMWAKFSAPEMEAENRLCILLRKGTVVTVVQRPAGYECVQVKGRPSHACFFTRNVSGTTNRAKEPVYDGFYLLD